VSTTHSVATVTTSAAVTTTARSTIATPAFVVSHVYGEALFQMTTVTDSVGPHTVAVVAFTNERPRA
jgi:hypothetical protein